MSEAGRSWTDRVTNSTLFSSLDAEEYLRWLSSRTQEVNRALPQFLHEFTHHWCFDSLVGSALAMVRMRAQRYALLSAEEHEFQVWNDLVRVETAERVLQPLMEGLALFAEFDIKPGAGRIVSQTTLASVLCFGVAFAGGAGRFSPEDISLAVLLQTTRRQPEFLERKAGIYAMPFEFEFGYLSGYLSVKALWATLAPKARSLQDRDVFLAFIRAWIFDDPQLALCITTAQDNEVRACNLIVQRLHERLRTLVVEPNLAVIVDRWERAVDAQQSTASALGFTNAELQRAEGAVILLNRDVQLEGPLSEFAIHAGSTLFERKYVTLSRMAATAEWNDTGVRITASDVTLDYEVVSKMPEKPSEGVIQIVYAARINCLLVYFIAGKETCLLKAWGSKEELDDYEMHCYLVNREVNDRIHVDLQHALTEVAEKGTAQVVLGHILEQLPRLCSKIYGPLATLTTRKESIEPVLKLLRRKGLLSIVDGDHGLVRGLAAIGLANTMGTDSASMMFYEGFFQLEEGQIERTIRDAQERHGMILLQPGGEFGGATALV